MLTVEINQRQLANIRRVFRDFPEEVPKVMQHSINRTADVTRKMVVDRMAAISPGLKKKDIRKGTKTKKASRTVWSALVDIKGPGIPLINLGAKIGRKTKVVEIATAKQSAWLFYNVFRKKYGDSAVYSSHYRLTRKVHKNITYQLFGQTKSLAGTGAFVATMPSGHKGIFKRREGFGSQAIKELRGPSIASMLERSEGLLNKIKVDTAKTLEIEIDKRTATYLAKAKAKAKGVA